MADPNLTADEGQYNLASDLIGDAVALRSAWIGQEQTSTRPNAEQLARWQAERLELHKQRQALDPRDRQQATPVVDQLTTTLHTGYQTHPAQPPAQRRLGPKHHEEISREIINEALNNSSTVDEPVAVFYGGQMGVGKSTAVYDAERSFDSHGGCVKVDVDQLRERHPYYSDIMRTDEKNVTYHTHPDASAWNKELTTAAAASKRNLVVDTLLSNPTVTADHVNTLKSNRYKTKAVFIATPEAISRLACIHGYKSKKARSLPLQSTDLPHRDKAYQNVANSVAEFEKNKTFDEIKIRDRDGNVLYNSASRDGTRQFASASQVLADGRTVTPTSQNLSDCYAQAIEGTERMKKPGPSTEDQNDAIDTILKAQSGHFKNLFTPTAGASEVVERPRGRNADCSTNEDKRDG